MVNSYFDVLLNDAQLAEFVTNNCLSVRVRAQLCRKTAKIYAVYQPVNIVNHEFLAYLFSGLIVTN